MAAQEKLDTLMGQLADMGDKLVPLNHVVEGSMVVARYMEDMELYRARVVTVEKKVTVSYIDFGNTEVVSVDDLYELPSGLEMMAPASAEAMLARDLPKQNTQEVLEGTLMEVFFDHLGGIRLNFSILG